VESLTLIATLWTSGDVHWDHLEALPHVRLQDQALEQNIAICLK
jgi:hypothetical protein